MRFEGKRPKKRPGDDTAGRPLVPSEVAHVTKKDLAAPDKATMDAIMGVAEDLRSSGFGSRHRSEEGRGKLDDQAMATQVLAEIDGLVHDTLLLMYGTSHRSLSAQERSRLALDLMQRYCNKLGTATLTEHFLGDNDINELHTNEGAANLVAEKILDALQAEYPSEYPSR